MTVVHAVTVLHIVIQSIELDPPLCLYIHAKRSVEPNRLIVIVLLIADSDSSAYCDNRDNCDSAVYYSGYFTFFYKYTPTQDITIILLVLATFSNYLNFAKSIS